MPRLTAAINMISQIILSVGSSTLGVLSLDSAAAGAALLAPAGSSSTVSSIFIHPQLAVLVWCDHILGVSWIYSS